MPDSPITQRLASLPKLSKLALRDLWKKLFKREPPPEIRTDLMLRIIAHRLQEQKCGELGDASCRWLRQLAATFEADPNAVISTRPAIKPGTRFVRQWKEQVHVVEVEADGYAYRGSRYENLSEIARLITGTRRSGPLFFGLKAKQSKDTMEVR